MQLEEISSGITYLWKMAPSIIIFVFSLCTLTAIVSITFTSAIPIERVKRQEGRTPQSQETQLFGKMECPTIEDAYYIEMDIGCKAHFNHTILSKLQFFVLKCHPLVENATCVWRYNNIVLGNSKEYAQSIHDKHTFSVLPSDDILTVDKSCCEGQFDLPLNTLISCTCYSHTIDKCESRSTRITSPDILDGN